MSIVPRPAAPLAFAALAAGCVTAIGALAAVTFWHVAARPADVVRPNLMVADVPVGGLPRDEVSQVVESRLRSYADATIQLATPGGSVRLRAGDLGYRPELAATLAQIEAVGVPLQREAFLAEWSGPAQPMSVAPSFSIDEAKLGAVAAQLAASIDRPAVDAQLRVNPDTSIDLIPARSGQRLDQAELRRRVQAVFRAMGTALAVPVETVTPAVTDDDARPAKAAAEQLVAGPIEVRAGDRSWTLSRGDLASWVVFGKDSAGKPTFELHPERPRNWLVDRAREVGRPARDARVKLVNGKPQVAQPEQAGIELDQAASLAVLKAAGSAPGRRVELVTRALAPTVMATSVAQMAFPDLVAEASTVYGGGIPERSHNVELAASRVDGAVVPAGATFSFNSAVGRTRVMDGYQMAYGIAAGDDGVQTVPSVAGGICQVATTLFQAAFWAGLPIVERHEHPYWIPRYGVPPRGLTGLDTTVDEDSGLDFQFKNTTGGPLLVHATTDGSKVTFQLLGTRPDWQVTVGQPVLSAFVKTDPTYQRQEDPTLEAGRAIQVEEARDGFDAVVTRTVTRGGQLLERLEVKSHYAPSHNVVLVGAKRSGG